MNHFELQILIQWVYGGAWDSEFLTSSQTMLLQLRGCCLDYTMGGTDAQPVAPSVSLSETQNLKKKKSQALLWTSRLRICLWTRSPGVSPQGLEQWFPKHMKHQKHQVRVTNRLRALIPHWVVLFGVEHPTWFWWIVGLKTSKSIFGGHFPRLMGPHSEKSLWDDLRIIVWDCGLLLSYCHTSSR